MHTLEMWPSDFYPTAGTYSDLVEGGEGICRYLTVCLAYSRSKPVDDTSVTGFYALSSPPGRSRATK